MPKFITRADAESKRQKAVEFLRRIGNDDLADDFASMSPEDYAEHKGFELANNPFERKRVMAGQKTATELRDEIAELKDRVEDLEEENEQLQSDLDAISDIVAPEEDEDEASEEDEEDEPGE